MYHKSICINNSKIPIPYIEGQYILVANENSGWQQVIEFSNIDFLELGDIPDSDEVDMDAEVICFLRPGCTCNYCANGYER